MAAEVAARGPASRAKSDYRGAVDAAAQPVEGIGRNRFAVIGAAAFFSTGGAGIKLCSLGGWQVAGLRSAVAAVVLALVFPAARRGWTRHTLMVGVAYASTLVLFALGNKLTTAANTIFLQSAAPLYLLLLSPWLLGERIRPRDLGIMAVIVAGLALFYVDVGAASRTAPNPRLGNALATGSGLCWALTLAGLRWLGRHSTNDDAAAMRSVIAGNLIAALVCIPMMGSLSATAVDWLVIFYLGAVQIGLSYALLVFGVRRVGAFEVSLLLLVEPALNPIWTWLVHGERPGALALAGGVIILFASTAKSWLDQRATA
jgi:drug/metabolite transporter, DME family